MTSKPPSNSKNWAIKSSRFVCFLDIMGFKDMVMRNSHDEVYDLMSKISKHRKTLENVDGLPEQYPADSLKTISFSDSILIFTKDESLECFEVLTAAAGWLFVAALESGIPLKGSIACGEISINTSRQIFFGQPLIDAYLLQEDVAFYGIAIHNTTEKFLNANTIRRSLTDSYKDCLAPFKSGKISHLLLDWTDSLDEKIAEKKRLRALELMKKQREKTSGAPRKYIDNTIDVITQIYSPK